MLLHYKEAPAPPGTIRKPAAVGINVLFLIPPAICFLAVNIDYLRLEASLLGLALLIAWIGRNKLHWTGQPPAWCAPLRRWSRSSFLACSIPAVVSAGLRIALLPWIREPHPVVPDEFSHLFLAKTLLAGRLANPTHPLWPFFESIHILSQPTYSSMYMAGQALFLAAGKILTGHFFGGVIISTALFCAALTWFLRGSVPPGWALYGGLLAAVRIGAASYWDNSYWGGSAGALGGALALGAFLRLRTRWNAMAAMWFAIGVILLGNTRPYEGAGLSAVLGIVLAFDFFRNRKEGRRRALAVAAIVFAIGGWAMTRHFKAVTGSALTLPYQMNQKIYGWPMTLPWSPVKKIEYTHPEFELYRLFEVKEHEYLTTHSKMPMGVLLKYAYWWRFFLGVGLSATLLFTTRILRVRKLRVIWIAAGIVALMAISEQSGYPHYIAPIAPAILLFAIMGLRYLAQSQSAVGPAVVRLIIPIWIVLLGVRGLAVPASAERNLYSWCCGDSRTWDRQPLLEKLAALPGQQLVIVTYDLASYDTFEWVYNEPDIDASKIVWARDMGPEKNRELLKYYPGRRVWHVLVSKDGVTIN